MSCALNSTTQILQHNEILAELTMAKEPMTVIRYMPGATKVSRRQKEVQLSAVRAHATRVIHQRKREVLASRQHALSSSAHNGRPRTEESEDEVNTFIHIAGKETPGRKCFEATGLRSSLTIHVDDIALNFTLVQLIDGSYFEYLPQLYAKVSPGHVLTTATTSVALACFACWTGRDEVLQKANIAYRRTLRQMQVALNSISSVCSDETLASVLLITFFELLAGGSSDQVSQSLTSHLTGATMILETRIFFGVKSKVGDQMLLQIWDMLVTQCHAQRRRLPASIDRLLDASTNPLKFAGLGSQQHTRELPRRIIDLRASVAEESLTDGVLIVHEALSIVISLNMMHNQIMEMWPYSTAESKPPLPGSFRGLHHVSPDGQAPWRFVSFYCMSTIWMRALIIAYIAKAKKQEEAWSDQDVEELMKVSRNEIEKAAVNICASVPQHLQPSFKRNHYEQIYLRSTVDRLRAEKESESLAKPLHHNTETHERSSDLRLPQQRISSACSLIWPLYVAGNSTQSEELRTYTVDRLRYIARSCRVQLASDAADSLESYTAMDEHGMESLYIL